MIEKIGSETFRAIFTKQKSSDIIKISRNFVSTMLFWTNFFVLETL